MGYIIQVIFSCWICHQVLDDDGLAAPGEIIRPNDIYINKQSPKVTRELVKTGVADRSVSS